MRNDAREVHREITGNPQSSNHQHAQNLQLSHVDGFDRLILRIGGSALFVVNQAGDGPMEHSGKNHRTESARRPHFGDAHDMVDHATQPFSGVPTPYWLAAAKRYDLFILENNCNG
ncbi:hypothetical protein [Rhodococcus sp. USK13]|uniref:hypothetical protein n=1 Tax=Rhodococcus sp. USK13 TaxID=2806442 RepID=UPI001BCEC95D|nr:hypothetical protein [Rhodococcus sp. USK13]